MASTLNLTLQKVVKDVLQGKLSLEQAQKLIEGWPAYTQHELREKSNALLTLSALVLSAAKNTHNNFVTR